MNVYSRRIGRSKRFLSVATIIVASLLWVSDFSAQQPTWKSSIPLGLPEDTWDYYVPRNNPMTAAKIALGRKLFFDARMSADGRISCASCHDPKLAFTDGRATASGIGGRRGPRNTPTLLNAMFNAGQFWDGRADTLEDQATQPLVNPLEMGNRSYDEVVNRLRAVPEYHAEFLSVFGSELRTELIGKALAAFERTLVSGDAPFDRFTAGDQGAISEAARRGFALFYRQARCSRCHTSNWTLPFSADSNYGDVTATHPTFFTDFNYHNTGVAANHPNFDGLSRQAYAAIVSGRGKEVIDALANKEGGQELGRALITYQAFDIGSYRTPSLRDVALTAPYFHNGSAKTLTDVVRFYNEGGRHNINSDSELGKLGLTEDEQRDLVSFLESLTGRAPREGK